MKVSVVIPVYNKGPFLREAVDSILAQTHADFELICVDDKSTDHSLEVLRTIQDPRLRIIELAENGGPGVAANAGLDAARGQYIVRMDADDIAVPERIALQVAFMDARPELVLSGGRMRLFGAEDETWNYPLDADACAAQLVFGVPVVQGASIMRRSVLEAHHLRYDPAWPRIGEDWLFWLRMAPYGRMANLPEVLVHYRRGPQNIAHGRDKAADTAPLQAAAFRALGIPFTAEQLELQLMGSTLFKRKPTPAHVGALRHWYNGLVALNGTLHFAPEPAFGQRVEQQWNKLFHHLPRYGMATAWAHMRLSGQWPMDRVAYALKYRINARLGRLPNG